MSEALKADGKTLVHVFCNTVIINSSNYQIPMANTDKISNLYALLKKKTGKDNLNMKKYVLMT